MDRSRWTSQARRWFEHRDIDQVAVFTVPLTIQFRSVTSRSGLLVHGPQGWGECAPFAEYDAAESSQWLRSAVDAATATPPPARRDEVAVNVTIPVCGPAQAADRVLAAGCFTAKVKVADPRVTLADDAARIAAVAEALASVAGPRARLRIDVNGLWQRDEACRALEVLSDAASPVGGLEYVEQPCERVEDLAYVRRHSGVRVAADESIRRAEDPFMVVEQDAADLAVIKVAPLGGVRRALNLAERLPIPVVVSSAIDTSIGLASGVELAAALPELIFACGLDTRRLLACDVTGASVVSSGGMLSVLDAARIRRGPLAADRAPVDEGTVCGWVSRVEDMIACLGADQ